MEIKRTMMVETEQFEVGDVVSFTLTDGETVQAMAMEQTPAGMLFMLVDCLAKEYPMFEDIDEVEESEISYMTSDLRKALNGEILARFPEEIKRRMVAVNPEGDMLRIPTEREIFGENKYGINEDKSVTQWKPMELRRNRIAFQGDNGAWEWYWLMNRHKRYASYFALVGNLGRAAYSGAGYSYGVRPVFLLS